jgi:membrane-bound inhibitor of C-type lysozyme
MKRIAALLILSSSCVLGHPVNAADSAAIQLRSETKIARVQANYDCGTAGSLKVTYVNADPNFLAIVPVPKQLQPLVFASVLSGSGTRYASGKYVWWTKGNSASLYDTTTGDNAPPITTCKAIN